MSRKNLIVQLGPAGREWVARERSREFAKMLLAKMPGLDLSWSAEMVQRWIDIWNRLLKAAQ